MAYQKSGAELDEVKNKYINPVKIVKEKIVNTAQKANAGVTKILSKVTGMSPEALTRRPPEGTKWGAGSYTLTGDAVKRGVKAVGRTLLKPVDKFIEKSKKMDAAREERNTRLLNDQGMTWDDYARTQKPKR